VLNGFVLRVLFSSRDDNNNIMEGSEMQITYREMAIRLQNHGWVEARCHGSHHQFRHPSRGLVVTVPGRRSSELLSYGVIRNIERVMSLAV